MSSGDVQLLNEAEVKAAIKRLGPAAAKVLETAVNEAADVVVRAANPLAPQPVIEKETVAKSESRVEVDVGPPKEKWYYRFAERGTRPHVVNPRGKKALHGGGDQFSSGHMVGGVAQRPFLRPALDENEAQAQTAAGKVFKRAVEAEAE
ncbi:MAG: hypothetical protein R6X32_06095 [Chloroflexota bacterium]